MFVLNDCYDNCVENGCGGGELVKTDQLGGFTVVQVKTNSGFHYSEE